MKIINGVDLPTRRPNPSDPFDVGADKAYPRAGVRQGMAGRWILTLWDEPGIEHVIDEEAQYHESRDRAMELGWLIIGSHRKSGTRLNGYAA